MELALLLHDVTVVVWSRGGDVRKRRGARVEDSTLHREHARFLLLCVNLDTWWLLLLLLLWLLLRLLLLPLLCLLVLLLLLQLLLHLQLSGGQVVVVFVGRWWLLLLLRWRRRRRRWLRCAPVLELVSVILGLGRHGCLRLLRVRVRVEGARGGDRRELSAGNFTRNSRVHSIGRRCRLARCLRRGTDY